MNEYPANYLNQLSFITVEETKDTVKKIVRADLDDKSTFIPENAKTIEILCSVVSDKDNLIGHVEVGSFKINELYSFSDTPVIEFNKHIEKIISHIKGLYSIDNDSIEFEKKIIDLWFLIRDFIQYTNISATHDECIAQLQLIYINEKNNKITHDKLKIIEKSFDVISNKIKLTDNNLNDMYEILEEGNIDLNFGFQLLD